MFGIVLIDKPQGLTSHDVVGRLRRRFQTRRVGHAGTLDPVATGLLVCAVGPATRFLQYLHLEPKEYETTFTFGQATETYDSEGAVTEVRDVPADLAERIEAALEDFCGDISQLPPAYSAVKVAGRPMYDYARKGIEVERKPRSVTVERFELLGVDGDLARFRIVCSGGTYVRTLAHDLGQTVGCGAHVSQLRRTQVGRFFVSNAASLEDVGSGDVIPLSEALDPMPIVSLNDIQVMYARQGRQVVTRSQFDGTVGLADTSGAVIGVGMSQGTQVDPCCIIPVEAYVDPA